MPYYGRDISDSALLRSVSGDLLQVETSDALSVIFDAPGVSTKSATALRIGREENQQRTGGTYDGLRNLFGSEPVEESPMMEPDELNQEFGWTGAKFDKPMHRDTASLVASMKREEQRRNDVLSRAPDTWTGAALRFGTALVTEAVDPLGAASMFIPVVGEARIAGMLAKAGSASGRFGVRAGVGFAEGVAGGAPLAALEYTASQRLQLDYTMSDALIETAFGGILGGGFHSIGGAIGDMFKRVSPDTQRDAFKGAVAQAVNGRDIDTSAYFAMDRIQRMRSDLMTTTTLSPGGRVDLPEFRPESRIDAQEARVGRVPVSETTYDNRRAANAAARQIETSVPVNVVQRPDGKYVLAQEIEVDAIRNTEGQPREFPDKRRASKAASRMGKDFKAVEVDGKWYAARLTPEQVKAVKSNPGLFEFGEASDGVRQRNAMAQEMLAKIPEEQKAVRDAVQSILERTSRVDQPETRTPRQIINEAVRKENDPANESMADPVAASEVQRASDRFDDNIDAVGINDEVDALRRAGELTDEDEAFISQIDTGLDQYAEMGRRAAFCMTRKA
jgi:hypothetical protein